METGSSSVRCVWLQAELTYAERQVEQSHPDVQSEEQDDVGHFAEKNDVAHVLLHRYWHDTDTHFMFLFKLHKKHLKYQEVVLLMLV